MLPILGTMLLAQAMSAPATSASPSPSPTVAPAGGVLTLSASALDLNPAQQRVVAVGGATPPLTATLERKLVQAIVDPAGTSITVTASQATGSDVIHLVDANGASADVAVRVAFNAGTIVPQATLKITGTMVDPDWLLRRVEAFVAQLTQSLPGTQVSVSGLPEPLSAPAPGAQNQVSIPVEINSPNGEYFDQSGATLVTVVNVPIDNFSPSLLFYDDDPERLSMDGVLFRGTVSATAPARLYYYHDDSSDPRRLAVLIGNDSQDPTSVQLIDATAGPNVDVMSVGNSLTRNFLLTKSRGEGTIVDLSQDNFAVVRDVAVGDEELVAGTIDLRVLSGGPVTVSVVSVSPGVDPRTLLGEPIVAGDGHHRTGVFRLLGYGNDTLAYSAGAPEDPKLVVGDREPTPPSVDPAANGHDYGDYGVLHDVGVTFDNPTDVSSTAYLYFRPLAGPARANFLIDGSPVELGCMREPVPYEIAAYTLEPHQTSRVQLQTMTDGGSFYPVEIGVTAAPPQPSPPPITAPDGCFPKPPASPSPSLSPSPLPSP
jgi:hypothetical protein